MLTDLHVRNLAVISEASVELGAGFNVLTGETGAGKSIVVDALALLRGARASTDLLRSGADRLVVSGRFDAGRETRDLLAAAGIEVDDELVVRREVEREGRNRAFVNDQPVTVKLLKEVMEPLLHIHAQREELGLASPELQRSFLDARGGEVAEALLRETAAAHATYRGLADRLDRVRGDRRLHAERVDLLRFQIGQIDGTRLEPGEDAELCAERDRLRNSEAIVAALGGSQLELAEEDGAAVERLARAEQQLHRIEEWLPETAAWLDELRELRIRASELADAVRHRLDGVAADPRRLDLVEERLDVIDRLRRKYGDSVSEILAFRAARAQELTQLEGDLADSSALEADVVAALAAYHEVAGRLSLRRREWGDDLVRTTQAQLEELALARARLSVDLGADEQDGSPLVVAGAGVRFGPHGFDRVELLLAANPGEEPRPLATSASGGELSRIYLALRLAAQQPRAARVTMVFDEADAGLGGEAASALGRKLRRLGKGSQILAVTHLAQVASFADCHFGVRKAVSRGRTETTVQRLGDAMRVEEVARMLAGDRLTEVSRTHAEELIAAADD